MGDIYFIFITALCLLGLNADASVVTNSSVSKWLFKREIQECAGAEYFLCKSGECLVKYSLCDSVVDCADRSDEAAAVCLALYKGRCHSNQWRCNYGACLKESQRCDQHVDCWDGSDEQNCPLGPSSSQSPLPEEVVCKQKEVTEKTKKYFVDKRKKMNWFEALLYCQKHYTRLAIVTSKEDNDNVVKVIEHAFPEIYKAGGLQFWIGGADIAKEGYWSWYPTGQDIVDGRDYTNWDPVQPDNQKGKDHCLEYWRPLGIVNWNDRPCDFINYVVCEHLE